MCVQMAYIRRVCVLGGAELTWNVDVGWPVSSLVREPSNPLGVPCPLLSSPSFRSKVVH